MFNNIGKMVKPVLMGTAGFLGARVVDNMLLPKIPMVGHMPLARAGIGALAGVAIMDSQYEFGLVFASVSLGEKIGGMGPLRKFTGCAGDGPDGEAVVHGLAAEVKSALSEFKGTVLNGQVLNGIHATMGK